MAIQALPRSHFTVVVTTMTVAVMMAQQAEAHLSMVCSAFHPDEPHLTTFFLGTYDHSTSGTVEGRIKITPPDGMDLFYNFTDICSVGQIDDAVSVSQLEAMFLSQSEDYNGRKACKTLKNSNNQNLVRSGSHLTCYTPLSNSPDPTQEWAISSFGSAKPYCLKDIGAEEGGNDNDDKIVDWWYAEVNDALPGTYRMEITNADQELQPGQYPPCSMEITHNRYGQQTAGAPVFMSVSVPQVGGACTTDVPSASLTNAITSFPTPCDGSRHSYTVSGFVCPIECASGFAAVGHLQCVDGVWAEEAFQCTNEPVCTRPNPSNNAPDCAEITPSGSRCAFTCSGVLVGYGMSCPNCHCIIALEQIECGNDGTWAASVGYNGCGTTMPSLSPSSLSPSYVPSVSPTTRHPTTVSPSPAPSATPSSSPTSRSPATQAPSLSPSSAPTTLAPTSSHPLTATPSSSPTKSPSVSPTSCSPTTVAPSESPTASPSASPTSSHPLTATPTISPTQSPSVSPTSCSPSTLTPSTWSPSASPTTGSPTTTTPTASPSFPVIRGIDTLFVRQNTLRLREASPWGGVGGGGEDQGEEENSSASNDQSPSAAATTTATTTTTTTPPATASASALSIPIPPETYFFVQNRARYLTGAGGREDITIRVRCESVSPKIRVTPKSGGRNSVDLEESSEVTLFHADPTVWECRDDLTLWCNGGLALNLSLGGGGGSMDAARNYRESILNGADGVSCAFDELVAADVLPADFVCDTPCYESSNDCSIPPPSSSDSSQQPSSFLSSVAVFRVSSRWDLNNDDDKYQSFTVQCSAESSDFLEAATFNISGVLENVVWPGVGDFTYVIRNQTLSSLVFPGPTMVATMSTSTAVTAMADGKFQGPVFIPDGGSCPLVYVGDIRVNVSGCTDRSVSFTTPTYAQMCGGESVEECGYQSVAIVNPYSDLNGLGGVLRCPSGCPGGGRGFFYTPRCVGFLDVATCSLLREEDQRQCAFGSGDSCRVCPENAFCPGGARCWPMRGFWTSREDLGVVHQCPVPSEVRCLGWSIADAEPGCGRGYEGVLCASCEKGYYAEFDLCKACPSGDIEERLMRLLLLGGACLLTYLLIRLAIARSQRNASMADRRVLLFEARDLILWIVLVLQAYSLVISSSTGLSQSLVGLLLWLNVMNFDLQAVAPECINDSYDVFWVHYALFSTALLLLLTVLCFEVKCLRQLMTKPLLSIREPVEGFVITLLTGMYVPATLFGIGAVHCIDAPVGDNSEGGGGGGSGRVSSANPNLQCFGPEHMPVGVMGALVLLLLSAGFPIMSYYKLHRVISTGRFAKIERRRYQKFFGDDYVPEYFWLYHVHFASMTVLCCSNVLLSGPNDSDHVLKLCLNSLAVTSYISLITVTKPFVWHARWKGPVKTSVLFTVLMATVLDYLSYLHSQHGSISQPVVESVGHMVLSLALFNFILLGGAFYFVVLHEKSRDYYKNHFLRERSKSHFVSRMRLGTLSRVSISNTRNMTQMSHAEGGVVARGGGVATMMSAKRPYDISNSALVGSMYHPDDNGACDDEKSNSVTRSALHHHSSVSKGVGGGGGGAGAHSGNELSRSPSRSRTLVRSSSISIGGGTPGGAASSGTRKAAVRAAMMASAMTGGEPAATTDTLSRDTPLKRALLEAKMCTASGARSHHLYPPRSYKQSHNQRFSHTGAASSSSVGATSSAGEVADLAVPPPSPQAAVTTTAGVTLVRSSRLLSPNTGASDANAASSTMFNNSQDRRYNRLLTSSLSSISCPNQRSSNRGRASSYDNSGGSVAAAPLDEKDDNSMMTRMPTSSLSNIAAMGTSSSHGGSTFLSPMSRNSLSRAVTLKALDRAVD
eukprot:jgi/Bigna1/81231/fgenesh1_pg.78_\